MSGRSAPILLYDRRTARLEIERVHGQAWMTFFYGHPWGFTITSALLCRPYVSRLYGAIQKHPVSRRSIAEFVSRQGVDLAEAQIPTGGFRSFNDFFIRRLKPNARPVAMDAQALTAPADSRLQAFTIEPDLQLTVKGHGATLPGLLGMSRLDDTFAGGLCLVFRLAPCDYHRFGYVDDGVQGRVHTIEGLRHSVSPLALRRKPDIHCTNYRHWSLAHGVGLGPMIQVEVGAMMVGSIVQHRPDGGAFRRGEEKGYFQFGGSTVILILQSGRVTLDPDIFQHSARGIETKVRYGERIGTVLTQ